MSNVKLFESKQIRSIWNEKEQKWFFSVIDVVGALTDSPDPKDYWYRIKKREKISGVELSTICRQLKLEAPDGKLRATDCANTEGLLRIIQSIPSPKAEPFKLWLARVGFERLEEIENPELAARRRFSTNETKIHEQTDLKRFRVLIHKKAGDLVFRKKFNDSFRVLSCFSWTAGLPLSVLFSIDRLLLPL